MHDESDAATPNASQSTKLLRAALIALAVGIGAAALYFGVINPPEDRAFVEELEAKEAQQESLDDFLNSVPAPSESDGE